MLNALRTVFLSFLVAVANSALAACPPAPEKPTEAAIQSAMRSASDHGYLWRISKDGRTSYLYGTIHVGKFEWIYPGPKVTAALRETDTIALELDMMDPEVRKRTNKEMASLHGNALPGPLEKRMRKQAESLCVPYEKLAGVPPEMQVAVLSIMVGRWEGLDASYGIDVFLAALGHQANKNMVSLETPEFQVQALLMHTPQETAAIVEASLDEMESSRSRKMLKRLADAWDRGNYAEMEHYEDWCDCLKTDVDRTMMKRMLDERNPAMAERIDALHHGGKQVFAAVGSMHMFGPMGLAALMEKRGYKVERVEFGTAQAGAKQ
ncbi:MAG TPA: TraB/GumN family protein [Gallionellaceae bacterium]